MPAANNKRFGPPKPLMLFNKGSEFSNVKFGNLLKRFTPKNNTPKAAVRHNAAPNYTNNRQHTKGKVASMMSMFVKKNNVPKKNNGPKKYTNNRANIPNSIVKRGINYFGGSVAKKAPQPKMVNGIKARINSLIRNIPNKNLAANKKRRNNRGAVGRLNMTKYSFA